MASLYLHIPFCRRLCGYCDFFKSVKMDRMSGVVEAMMGELESERDFISTRKLSTIYFGGGTPSLLSGEQVGGFMDRIAKLYDVGSVEEVTLEANPDDLTYDYLVALRDAGVDRLSIGVQSFDDGALRFMNRRHTAQQAIRAIEDARRVGFDNIAIDLIFGVDGFGEEVLRESLTRAVELEVQHVAAYHLTIEEGTMFAKRLARGEISVVAEEVSDREFEVVREVLLKGGYEHYEVSNYAKKGRRSRHNSAYWRGEEYLGIGAGAHSFSGEKRRWGCDSIEDYLAGGESRYGGEELTRENRHNERVMTRLRCCEGIDLLSFEREFGEDSVARLMSAAKNSITLGDLVCEDGHLRIPTSRFLRSDYIIELLFDQPY